MDSGDRPVTDTAETASAPLGVQIDLDAIETDLSDVEVALARLEAGSYWTCEVTGQPLTDDLLAANPVARRLTDH